MEMTIRQTEWAYKSEAHKFKECIAFEVNVRRYACFRIKRSEIEIHYVIKHHLSFSCRNSFWLTKHLVYCNKSPY